MSEEGVGGGKKTVMLCNLPSGCVRDQVLECLNQKFGGTLNFLHEITVIWFALSSTSETLPLASGSGLRSGEVAGPVAWWESTVGERAM